MAENNPLPLDPELAALFELTGPTPGPFTRESIPELREYLSKSMPESMLKQKVLDRGLDLRKETITSFDGTQLTAYVVSNPNHTETGPGIYNIHGGGMDESIAFASKLWAAGIPTELHICQGGFHGFDNFAPHAAMSQSAFSARNNWVTRLLGT